MKVISWKNRPIFTEIILLLSIIIINAFDHMEFCLVINLEMVGNQALWPSIFTTRYVSFATTLNTR